jgi:hypothetical protein
MYRNNGNPPNMASTTWSALASAVGKSSTKGISRSRNCELSRYHTNLLSQNDPRENKARVRNFLMQRMWSHQTNYHLLRTQISCLILSIQLKDGGIPGIAHFYFAWGNKSWACIHNAKGVVLQQAHRRLRVCQ